VHPAVLEALQFCLFLAVSDDIVASIAEPPSTLTVTAFQDLMHAMHCFCVQAAALEHDQGHQLASNQHHQVGLQFMLSNQQ
jgi:hypothetical protein